MTPAFVPPAAASDLVAELPAVTVLRAPRGWGKAGFATWRIRNLGTETVPIWIPVPSTGSRRRLWQTVRERVQSLGIEVGPELTGEALGAVTAAALAQRGGRIVLIVSGYHRLVDRRFDEEIVRFAQSGVGVHVMLLSRMSEPIEDLVSRLPDGVVIGPEQLALDGPDVAHLARALGVVMGAEEARQLATDTGGWPAVIRLRLQAGEQDSEPLIERYLASVLQSGEAAHYSHTLMSLCLADHLDARSLRVCLDAGQDPGTVLHQLADAGVLAPDGQVPKVVRRAAAAFITETNPSWARTVHRRLALLAQRDGTPASALHHATRAADIALTEHILLDSWMALIDDPVVATAALQGLPGTRWREDARLAILHEYVSGAESESHVPHRGLAPTVAARIPVLLVRWGMSRLLAVDLIGACAVFADAFRVAQDLARPADCRTAAACHALGCAMLGQRRTAQRWCGLAGIPGPEEDPTAEAATALALVRWFMEADDAATDPPAPVDVSGCPIPELVTLAEVMGMTRQMRASQTRAAAVAALADRWATLSELDRPNLAAMVVFSAMVDVLLALGRVDECRTLVTTPCRALRSTGVPAARVALYGGELERAVRLTADAEQWMATFPRGALELLLVRASALYRLGRLERAIATLQLAVTVSTLHDLYRPFASVPAADLEQIAQGNPRIQSALSAAGVGDRPPFFPAPAASVTFTDRERQVLSALDAGLSVEAIAALLYVSVNTVKSHLRAIYVTLGVHNRVEAVRHGHYLGLLGRETGALPPVESHKRPE
ncbi:helix-turn-helix transcriptional regulator [Ruania alba]|uniref:helix-turn-helix transcriptional regulator n=1 Tax=Ruania alba TaxID=648782 RepID=UPI0015874F96|nr:LuxR family transcriptional regulator [Ruania alba]